jgi:putative SOS response-associated peptidase YedK
MCGRYTSTVAPAELSKQLRPTFGRLKITETTSGDPYNIAPSNDVLVIVAPEGKPEARMLRWGLVPPWATDLKVAYKMINARLETVTEKPSYRDLFATALHRGLQFTDGWIEWLLTGEEGSKQTRQPYLIQLEDRKPFAFPSLWTANMKIPTNEAAERPSDEQGEIKPIESCSLITCSSKSNQRVHEIHPRMPATLTEPEDQLAWIDPSIDSDDAIALCTPSVPRRFTARAINRAINKVGGIRGPELLLPPSAFAAQAELSVG